MGLISRAVFYPSLVYNVVLEKVTSRNWYDHIDETVILGALPFKSMTKQVRNRASLRVEISEIWCSHVLINNIFGIFFQLVEIEKVKGVVTTNEPYETKYLCNNKEVWVIFLLDESGNWLHFCRYRWTALGSVYTKHQRQRCNNSAMTLAILFPLKTMDLLENGLQPQSGVTPLFSMKMVSLVSSQSSRSIDADTWCKRALTLNVK